MSERNMSIEELRELLAYEPDTGIVRWRVQPATNVFPGSEAGCLSQDGYMKITIRGMYFRLHRVIWAIVTGQWPPVTIDHKDLDRANNRWSNLRLATMSEQNRNRGAAGIVGRSGVKGVSWCEFEGRWRVQIRAPAEDGSRGRRKYVGSFATVEAGAAAYAAAVAEHHGEFARTA